MSQYAAQAYVSNSTSLKTVKMVKEFFDLMNVDDEEGIGCKELIILMKTNRFDKNYPDEYRQLMQIKKVAWIFDFKFCLLFKGLV